MTLSALATFAIFLCLIIGSVFTLVAGIGLVKLNDSMARLHAPTKAGTLGIGAFLVASMINSFTFGDGALHELLIMGFLFVTAPVSANFIAKVTIHKGACMTPPPPPQDDNWATLSTPDDGQKPDEPTRA
ncbi:monovalent cation/H(+) antiporter subunit G [Flavimaricola marinus]|uniref:Na(+)/H(+) antiporter subunit G n=1 Tax=Flavimaricola marinus TaxID=1819565 RepID=A0A238LDY1_9RHOB|nr:monovalent cation/H(+) antiporter subunit G [Flavimaricola marinus]SMY07140.1 Na(+)/H(+) antiporter subunit G [Flavimaricola marinus]